MDLGGGDPDDRHRSSSRTLGVVVGRSDLLQDVGSVRLARSDLCSGNLVDLFLGMVLANPSGVRRIDGLGGCRVFHHLSTGMGRCHGSAPVRLKIQANR